MNTQLKLGDRVKVISGANMPEHNNQCGIIQQIGNTDMPLFTDYIAVRLDSGIVALCYTYEDDNRVVNIELSEAAKPTPKWLPIDKDNLYPEKVAAMNITQPTHIFTGTLELNRYDDTTIYIGNGQYLSNFTHYISLTDLLNLPIAE